LLVLEYLGGKGGGMNAKRCQDQVLQGCFLHFWKDMESERKGVYFQQHGALSHKAKTTLKWLNSHGIFIFPQLPSSPDLSPIEPVWHKLKTHLRAQ
ncbi:hypothetical protein BT96DRAFT_759168, partial [Gymnopus androsaceus JB14]